MITRRVGMWAIAGLLVALVTSPWPAGAGPSGSGLTTVAEILRLHRRVDHDGAFGPRACLEPRLPVRLLVIGRKLTQMEPMLS
jgi:hypothetical protein